MSHSSLDKLPIFAGFGVPEVWRFQGDRVSNLVLDEGSYREVPVSRVLPAVSADLLVRFLHRSRELSRLAWVKEIRAWARAQRGGDAVRR